MYWGQLMSNKAWDEDCSPGVDLLFVSKIASGGALINLVHTVIMFQGSLFLTRWRHHLRSINGR